MYDLNKFALEKAVEEMQEDVLGVLRVTLDAQNVVSVSKHLDAGLFRASHYFCLRRHLPHLHFVRKTRIILLGIISCLLFP